MTDNEKFHLRVLCLSIKDDNVLLEHIGNQIKHPGREEQVERRENLLKKFLIKLLKECVESEKPVALKRILFWIKRQLASHPSIGSLFSHTWPLEEEEKEDGFIWNNRAMIRACEKNDFMMVSYFMSVTFGQHMGRSVQFRINDTKFKDTSTREINLFYENYNKEMEVLKHIRNFQATCTPAFLVAKFRNNLLREGENRTSFDPIAASFMCIKICKRQEVQFHEYGDQFRKVQASLEDFLGDVYLLL